ncbi:MAG: cytochrome c oxidase subunit 4 [Verrucomicrobia bacterium]|nr:MAG: cytochrome c oxidase subunit 4 [Verrucomicrobiota bacterium]
MSASPSHVPATQATSHGDHAAADQAAEAAHIAAHLGAYVKVGVGLLVLTGITVGLSYVDFGSRSMNIIVGMIVATIKASMVAAIFMHLKGEKMTIWRFLIMTCIFAMGLFFLTFLAHSDPIMGTSYSTH